MVDPHIQWLSKLLWNKCAELFLSTICFSIPMYQQVSLQKGHHVIMKDNIQEGLTRGQEQIYKGYVDCICYIAFTSLSGIKT